MRGKILGLAVFLSLLFVLSCTPETPSGACTDFTFSSCPTDRCVQKCVPRVSSGGIATKDCDGPGSCVQKIDDGGLCATNFDPVCGVDGKTYPNACKATAAGIKVAAQGECKQQTTNGFRNAYWRCYDGDGSKEGDPTSCKSSDVWRGYADAFCNGHCYADGSKCGVNTFQVLNECSDAAGGQQFTLVLNKPVQVGGGVSVELAEALTPACEAVMPGCSPSVTFYVSEEYRERRS